MATATLRFDLDNEQERTIHDAATKGWRYKAVLEHLISGARTEFAKESVKDIDTAEAVLSRIKRLALRFDLPEVAAQTGVV